MTASNNSSEDYKTIIGLYAVFVFLFLCMILGVQIYFFVRSLHLFAIPHSR
jgi:hypothetical protein